MRIGSAGFTFLLDLGAQRGVKRRLADAAPDDRFVPGDWFQLAKVGSWYSPVYGEVDITRDDLQTMLRNWETETVGVGGELPIDYDHLGDAPEKPGDGKAAGWIKALQLRANGDELWCRADWTKPAAKLIANGEYRFVSPYFLTQGKSKQTGKNIGPWLRAAAVTNRPFLEGMTGELGRPAIAASDVIARHLKYDRRLAVPVSRTLTPSARRQPAAAEASQRRLSERPRRGIMSKGTERNAAVAAAEPEHMEGSHMEGGHHMEGAEAEAPSAPGLTCPHCGAPVSHDGRHNKKMEGGEGMDGESHLDPESLEGEGYEGGHHKIEGGPMPGEPMEGDDAPPHKAVPPHAAPPQHDDVDGDGDGAADDDGDGMEGTEPVGPAEGHTMEAGRKRSMRESQLESEVRQLREQVVNLNAAEQQRRRQSRRALADGLIKQGLRSGRITMADVGTAQKPGWARNFAFRDPDGFRGLLGSAAKVRVQLGEQGSSDEGAADNAASTASRVDKLVEAYMAKNPTARYSDAVKQVLSENRALSEQYDREMIGDRQSPAAAARMNIRRL